MSFVSCVFYVGKIRNTERSYIEFEIVTADGKLMTANEVEHSDRAYLWVTINALLTCLDI